MNTIRIQLTDDASAETIARAHAAIEAFAGNLAAAASSFGAAANAAAHDLTPAAAAAAQTGPVELDVAGLPWHQDIHASTKTKTQKGEWTKRKGADEATITRVTAELRAMYPAPAAAEPAATPAGLPVIGVNVPKVGIAIAPKSEYQKLVDFIATNVASGKIGQDTIDATFASNNSSLAGLAGDEASSQAYREAFESFIAG